MRFKLFSLLLIGLGVGLFLGALILWGFSRGTPNQQKAPVTGIAAPDFELEDLQSNLVSVSQFRGKAVLVNFWATWCEPCKEEMPMLVQASEEYAGQLVVLGVNDSEPARVVRDFIEQYEITFPILLDPVGRATGLYLINAYPTTYFIDPNGVVRGVQIGILSESSLAAQLEKVGIPQ